MSVTSPPHAAARTPRRRTSPPRAGGRRFWGRAGLLLAVPALVVLVVFFVVPALRLLWLSVTSPEPGFGNYAAIVRDDVAVTVVLRTLGMAAIVTANTRPAASPARGEISRRPSAATAAAAPAMASADGNLVTSSPVPPSRTATQMRM